MPFRGNEVSMPLSGLITDPFDRFGPHDHVALFYETPEERLAALVPFIKAGLGRSEKCLLVVAHDDAEEILTGLRLAGIDVGHALNRGALLLMQAPGSPDAGPRVTEPVGLVEFFIAANRQAASERYAALRLAIDMALLFPPDGDRRKFHEYRDRFSRFIFDQPSLSLCMHRIDAFSPETHLDTLRSHPLVVYKGRVCENFYYLPVDVLHDRLDPAAVFSQRLSHLVDREEQEARVRRQTIRLKRFRDTIFSLLGPHSVPDLLQGITEGIVSLGYRMCWIGMSRPDGTVEPVAICGDTAEFLQEFRARWDEDTPLSKGPTGTCIRMGKPDIVRDITRSVRFAPWKEKALAKGYRSAAAVPLREEGKVAGAITAYSTIPDAFDKEAVEELNLFALQASLVLQRAREFRALALSEDRFRKLFDHIPAACITYDREGIVRHWNLHCQALYGYSRDEAVGKSIFDLFVPPEDAERVRRVVGRVFAGESYFNVEWRNRTASGETRWVLTNSYPYKGGGDTVEAGIGVSVDITDRVGAQEAREILQRKLAQAQKMEAVGSLAGGIAHEFNDLLGSIIGHASLIQARLKDEDPLMAPARKIGSVAERAAELNRKLIGFSRGGAHNARRVGIGEIVSHLLPVITRTLGPAISVRTELDPDAGEIFGDADELQHGLLNLCLNARDAMPSGGTISIRASTVRLSPDDAVRLHVAGPGEYTSIEVRDTGEGMDEEVQRRIFEPLFTTRRGEGHSGMGLAMVYGIVKSHSGGILVESAPSKGTTVRIFLPSVGRPGEGVGIAMQPDPYPKGEETVLVVDDEPEIRDMVDSLLSALGYRTVMAADGEEAVGIVREGAQRLDIVLLDLIMPKVGGREAFRAIHSLRPELPVLLSSGFALDDLVRDLIDAGASGFIQKPYGMSDLARAVRRVLDDPRKPAGTG